MLNYFYFIFFYIILLLHYIMTFFFEFNDNNNNDNKNKNKNKNNEYFDAININLSDNVKNIKYKDLPYECDKLNRTLLDLYLFWKTNNKNAFEKKLLSCIYAVCDFNQLEMSIKQILKSINSSNSVYKNSTNQIINTSDNPILHSYFLCYDPDYNNISSIGLGVKKIGKKKIIQIVSPDYQGNCMCVQKYSNYFKIERETQEKINFNFENYFKNNICNIKGLLIPFLWKYIRYLRIETYDGKYYYSEDYKDKIYNLFSEEEFENDLEGTILNDTELSSINMFNISRIRIFIPPTDITFDKYKSVISAVYNSKSKMNCKDFVYKMFGKKIIKKLKFKLYKNIDKENKKSKLNNRMVNNKNNNNKNLLKHGSMCDKSNRNKIIKNSNKHSRILICKKSKKHYFKKGKKLFITLSKKNQEKCYNQYCWHKLSMKNKIVHRKKIKNLTKKKLKKPTIYNPIYNQKLTNNNKISSCKILKKLMANNHK